jgi:hypothetical protein
LLVAGHAPPPTRITATASRLILRIGISSPILTAGIEPRRITCEASFLRRLGAPTSRGRLPICSSCPKAKSPLEITMAVGHSVGYPSRRKTIRAPGFPRPGALSRLWPWPSSSSSVLTAQTANHWRDRATTGHDQPAIGVRAPNGAEARGGAKAPGRFRLLGALCQPWLSRFGS